MTSNIPAMFVLVALVLFLPPSCGQPSPRNLRDQYEVPEQQTFSTLAIVIGVVLGIIAFHAVVKAIAEFVLAWPRLGLCLLSGILFTFSVFLLYGLARISWEDTTGRSDVGRLASGLAYAAPQPLWALVVLLVPPHDTGDDDRPDAGWLAPVVYFVRHWFVRLFAAVLGLLNVGFSFYGGYSLFILLTDKWCVDGEVTMAVVGLYGFIWVFQLVTSFLQIGGYILSSYPSFSDVDDPKDACPACASCTNWFSPEDRVFCAQLDQGLSFIPKKLWKVVEALFCCNPCCPTVCTDVGTYLEAGLVQVRRDPDAGDNTAAFHVPVVLEEPGNAPEAWRVEWEGDQPPAEPQGPHTDPTTPCRWLHHIRYSVRDACKSCGEATCCTEEDHRVNVACGTFLLACLAVSTVAITSAVYLRSICVQDDDDESFRNRFLAVLILCNAVLPIIFWFDFGHKGATFAGLGLPGVRKRSKDQESPQVRTETDLGLLFAAEHDPTIRADRSLTSKSRIVLGDYDAKLVRVLQFLPLQKHGGKPVRLSVLKAKYDLAVQKLGDPSSPSSLAAKLDQYLDSQSQAKGSEPQPVEGKAAGLQDVAGAGVKADASDARQTAAVPPHRSTTPPPAPPAPPAGTPKSD